MEDLDIERIKDSPHLLDLLIQMEDVLDSLDIYVFKNWVNGEVVDGPRVRRYWLSFTLRYDYTSMPDPQAVRRLVKHGIKVEYDRNQDDQNQQHWLVTIRIPRRLIGQMSAAELGYYDEIDDDVDIDDVEDAKDDGVTDETGFIEPDDGDTEGDNESDEDTPDEEQRNG